MTTTGSAAEQFFVDTTEWSFLHALLRDRTGKQRSRVGAYLVAILLTYAPLVIAVLGGDRDAPSFSFFADPNVLCMFFVTLPTILLLTATDDRALQDALKRIQRDGILVLPDVKTGQLQLRWRARFRLLNVTGAGLAVVTGAAAADGVYHVFARHYAAFTWWAAPNGRFLPSGYMFLFSVLLFFALVAIYLVRVGSLSLLLRDIVEHAELHMLPGHPDRCGGLRPIGRLGLRNQYALTVSGFNVAVLALEFHYLFHVDFDQPGDARSLVVLFAIVAMAYVLFAPVVFLGPLLAFRDGMKRAKDQLMSEVAQRLRLELQRFREQVPDGTITKEDEDRVDRLRKVGRIIEELPVWPFDASTLRRFITAYAIPIAGGLLANLAATLLKHF